MKKYDINVAADRFPERQYAERRTEMNTKIHISIEEGISTEDALRGVLTTLRPDSLCLSCDQIDNDDDISITVTKVGRVSYAIVKKAP